MSGDVVVVDALVGAGKSTLTKSIKSWCEKRGRRVAVFREVIAPEFLNLMLSDPKYLFAFQAGTILQKAALIEHAVRFATITGALVIVDRGMIGDFGFALMHYEAGRIDEREWQAYTSIVRTANAPGIESVAMRKACQLSSVVKPRCNFKTVWLSVDPSTAMDRMRARNNPIEVSSYDLAFFARLHSIYSQLFACGEAQVVDFSPHATVVDSTLPDEFVEQFLRQIGIPID